MGLWFVVKANQDKTSSNQSKISSPLYKREATVSLTNQNNTLCLPISFFQPFCWWYTINFFHGVPAVTFSRTPRQPHRKHRQWPNTSGVPPQKGVHTRREEGRPLLGETSQEQWSSQAFAGEEKDKRLRAGESFSGPERRKFQAQYWINGHEASIWLGSPDGLLSTPAQSSATLCPRHHSHHYAPPVPPEGKLLAEQRVCFAGSTTAKSCFHPCIWSPCHAGISLLKHTCLLWPPYTPCYPSKSDPFIAPRSSFTKTNTKEGDLRWGGRAEGARGLVHVQRCPTL